MVLPIREYLPGSKMQYKNGPKEPLNPVQKRAILIEALSYIQRFKEQIIVIKYGGAAMVQEEFKFSFAQDVTLLHSLGLRPVIVHGGGPEITKAISTYGVETQFIDGLRVTDLQSLKISEMVLSGQVNKEIVAQLNDAGSLAVGLSGKDGRLIEASKLQHKEHDLGYVGKIDHIEPKLLINLLRDGYIPVLSPIGMGQDGHSYNINADTVASHIAAALKARKAIFMTDVAGILKDKKLISRLTSAEAEGLIQEEVIQGGMLPKVRGMIYALKQGVGSVHIIDGRDHHALIGELFTDAGTGTMLTA